jgi:hypothetical protein
MATRQRLLDEMLGSVRDAAGGAWSVLVLDPTTTKVLSNVAGVADIMDYGVSRERLHSCTARLCLFAQLHLKARAAGCGHLLNRARRQACSGWLGIMD